MKIRSTKFILLLSLAVSTLIVATNAQAPETDWEKTFGGNDEEIGFSVQQTIDGGYIIAGTTLSYVTGYCDVYLVKTDGGGNLQWEKTFGGSEDDWGRSVRQTSDGGYIIAGHTKSFGADESDVYLVKTDGSGNLQWEKNFGMEWGKRLVDEGYSVQQTSDGGYIITGVTYYDYPESSAVYLVKTDGSGNLQWMKFFPYIDPSEWQRDFGRSVQQTTDGGYIIAGVWFDVPEHHVYLIKTDGGGNLQWDEIIYTIPFSGGSSVQQTADGGYIIAGGCYSEPWGESESEALLVKTDGGGNLQWEKTFGESLVDYWSESVQQTADGGYITAGYTVSYGGKESYVYLVKTDSSGNLQWEKNIGIKDMHHSGHSVQQTSDGGYIITGSVGSYGVTDSDVYLIKLGPVVIPSFVDTDPDTLNVKSNGQWVTAYIELPEGYNVEDIDLDSVELRAYEDFCLPAVNDPQYDFVADSTVYIVDHDGDGILERLAKFNRAIIVEYLGAVDFSEYESSKFYDVSLKVCGELSGGLLFEGSDTVRVKHK